LWSDLGDKGEAQEYYQNALQEFPGSHMAQGGLEYLEQEK
jgi:hypothetical protein